MPVTGMTAFPNPTEARKAAEKLLKNKQIVCANIIPGMVSQYWWQGKIQNEKETLLVFKTSNAKRKQAIQELEKLHPYTTPVIETWKSQWNPKAKQWLKKELRD